MKGMQLTPGQRVTQARKMKKFSQAALAKALNLTPAGVSHIETGKSKLTIDNVLKIAAILGVNSEWILSGKGDINTDSRTNTENQEGYAQGQENSSFLEEPNIVNNKTGTELVKFGTAQKANPEARYLTAHQIEGYTPVPFIPVSARASFIDIFPVMNYEQMESWPVYNLDPVLQKKGAVVIEVDGDSMEPRLLSGDKVLGLPIDTGDWQYQTAGVYAVVFDNQFTIKRINSNTLSREGGEIELKADNGGATLAVPGKAIRSMWKIIRGVDTTIS